MFISISLMYTQCANLKSLAFVLACLSADANLVASGFAAPDCETFHRHRLFGPALARLTREACFEKELLAPQQYDILRRFIDDLVWSFFVFIFSRMQV